MRFDKAVTRIFFGGCHVELERRRREDRGAVGAEEGEIWGGGVPLPRKFLHFCFKMVSFCACHACVEQPQPENVLLNK